MVKCPDCSKELVEKPGKKKFCAQIGNPELAIVETEDPHFCEGCSEYFLTTEALGKAIMQIKESKNHPTQNIESGIYS